METASHDAGFTTCSGRAVLVQRNRLQARESAGFAYCGNALNGSLDTEVGRGQLA